MPENKVETQSIVQTRMSTTKQKSKAASSKQTSAATQDKSVASKKVVKKVSITSEQVSAHKKSTIHPNYREISVEMTDGVIFKTYSTYHNDFLKLDVDVKTHPAWTKDANYVNTRASAVAKFNSRFSGVSFISKK